MDRTAFFRLSVVPSGFSHRSSVRSEMFNNSQALCLRAPFACASLISETACARSSGEAKRPRLPPRSSLLFFSGLTEQMPLLVLYLYGLTLAATVYFHP